MMRIGFIGLGKMGSGMAACILRGGYSLTVYDVQGDSGKFKEKGASWATSPKKVEE